MDYVLVALDANYADEFDVNSLWVTTQEEYEEVLRDIDKYFVPDIEFYFGTNEFISFDTKDDILSCIDAAPISKEFYEEFVNLIGETYGLISIPEMVERFKREDDEE
jgi:hypothetical protein